MAKYGKNNYFDGVVLPEPKEEALRRMAKGVKLGYGEKMYIHLHLMARY